ncbi:MAG: hypothetical protein NXI00_23570 [Cytophagales bacterium]|nr:hypothetical protein [Cytophagales bacterium]
MHTGGGIALNFLSNANEHNHSIFNNHDRICYVEDVENNRNINFQNITIAANRAEYGAAIFIDDAQSSTPTFKSCLFLNNKAYNYGGAIVFQEFHQAVSKNFSQTHFSRFSIVAHHGRCILQEQVYT